ncbi:MAG: DUF115 domain-containing protein [Gammaproteobacteria bacterium]|nr:DUF115 domain-containing protein [Gammaproteobacteria bacterium]
MIRLNRLYNRHLGERIVLVANGPSLNRMGSLKFLQHEITFGLNKIYLGIKQFGFYPRYYVAVNDKVIAQSVQQIKALNCVKFISARNASLVPEDALTYHINTRRGHFCRDITQVVSEGWTVTYVALQIAYYLGFHEVVIIGMDHRFQYTGQPNEAHRLNGPDPNHFSPDYFGGGQTWDNPDIENSEVSYRIARAEFEKAGRRIIDATADGACTIFEKADYRHLFGLGT